MLKRLAAAMAGVAIVLGASAGPSDITAFSAAQPGTTLPPGWSILPLPRKKVPDFRLVNDAGVTVLHIHSDSAVGSALFRMNTDPRAASRLSWRWKVDHALAKARLGLKEGDDFAARVYVSFDFPLDALSFTDRTKMTVARLLYGSDLPAATICYIWDNRMPVGTHAWNPFTDRMRMVVLQSGNAHAGEWMDESRDVDADFREAFGAALKGPTPAIVGVAVSADTDQTRESVNAWFGDLRLEPRK